MILAVVAAATLALGGTAFAQSQQGGYLGLNPAGHQVAGMPAPADVGSHQGGYLGQNAGGNLAPGRAAGGDMTTTPAAWCHAASIEPDRCASRATFDHGYCMQHDPDHYAACRRTMDFIGWHN
jgi:hypothetical protein